MLVFIILIALVLFAGLYNYFASKKVSHTGKTIEPITVSEKKQKPVISKIKKYPPRSMTAQEWQAWYIHKNYNLSSLYK